MGQPTLLSPIVPTSRATPRPGAAETLGRGAGNPSPGPGPFGVALTGMAAAGKDATGWTLGGKGFLHQQDNTPADPTLISPVQAVMPVPAGATNISFAMEANMFVVLLVPLQ